MMSILKIIPFCLLAIACIAYFQLMGDQTLPSSLTDLSYVIYGVGMLLGWWFNRSRIFFVVTVLALSQYGLSDLAAAATGMSGVTTAVFPVISTLLPINIFVFSLLKERGIFTAWGLGRFAIIAFQLMYIAIATITNDNTLLSFFERPASGDSLSMDRAMPQSAIAAYSIVFLLFALKQWKVKSYLNNAFIAVLAASVVGLYLKAQPLALPVFFGAAGVILIIAVIQDSYAMAYLDELTGVPARRALKEDLMKLRGEYAIAMVDIDFFKKFNDTYGHDVGDDVLRLVASVLQKVTGGGKAFRYGGEEFTIVFPHSSIEEAMPHLEKIRELVEKTPYAYFGKKDKAKRKSAKKLFVTISIGVAERSEKHSQPEAVVKAADTALYRAKKKGRNCVSK